MWVAKYKGTNRRLWNYSCIMSDFQFDFKFRKGSSMGDCDWLSRFALPAEKNDPAEPDREALYRRLDELGIGVPRSRDEGAQGK